MLIQNNWKHIVYKTVFLKHKIDNFSSFSSRFKRENKIYKINHRPLLLSGPGSEVRFGLTAQQISIYCVSDTKAAFPFTYYMF